MNEDIHFFNAVDGRIDPDAGVVRGVSLITMGTARGHNLEVDDKTLTQLKESLDGTPPPGIKAKLNHRSGVEAVFGYINNFQVEGNKLTGDLNMLRHHKDFNQTMEQITTMPGQIGLSVAFQGDKEPGKDGKVYARCKRIVSVDLVPDPAANPDGMFESKVDNDIVYMDQEPNVEELLQGIAERLDGVEEFQGNLEEAIADQLTEDYSDEDYSDEDYSDEADYADDEVEYEDSYEDSEAEYEPVEYSSIDDALTYLEAKAEGALAAEEEARENMLFENVEDKVVELAEINQQLQAENEVLQEALELQEVEAVPTSSEAFLFGADAGEGTFEFAIQQHAAGEAESSHEAIRSAVADSPAAHRDWLIRQGILEN